MPSWLSSELSLSTLLEPLTLLSTSTCLLKLCLSILRETPWSTTHNISKTLQLVIQTSNSNLRSPRNIRPKRITLMLIGMMKVKKIWTKRNLRLILQRDIMIPQILELKTEDMVILITISQELTCRERR